MSPKTLKFISIRNKHSVNLHGVCLNIKATGVPSSILVGSTQQPYPSFYEVDRQLESSWVRKMISTHLRKRYSTLLIPFLRWQFRQVVACSTIVQRFLLVIKSKKMKKDILTLQSSKNNTARLRQSKTVSPLDKSGHDFTPANCVKPLVAYRYIDDAVLIWSSSMRRRSGLATWNAYYEPTIDWSAYWNWVR